jgi:signal transduction histidine kinase
VGCSEALCEGRAAVRVRVTDNGSGLTSDQRLRLFEPFYTTKTRGAGLGLAVARRIVEAHGGHIRVCAGPGPGTAIEVLLPKGSP